MAAPAEGSTRHPPVRQMLPESFAVIAHRNHTFAARNCRKFRGVFWVCGCQTLFSRPTFVTIRPAFVTIARFWGDDRPHDGIGMVGDGPFAQPVGRTQTPFVVSGTPNGKPFMANRQTFLTKHKNPW